MEVMRIRELQQEVKTDLKLQAFYKDVEEAYLVVEQASMQQLIVDDELKPLRFGMTELEALLREVLHIDELELHLKWNHSLLGMD